MHNDKKIIFSINGSISHCGVDEYTLHLDKTLSDSFDLIHIVKPNSDICKNLIEKNIKWLDLGLSYKDSFTKIKGYCKRLKPDIIFIHTAKEYFLILAIKMVLPDCKVIFIRHNSFKLSSFPNYFFLKLADAIVAPSNYCADVVKNQFPKLKSKIFVIYNAIESKNSKKNAVEDNEKIEDNENNEKVENRITIGFIGRLTYQKGIELLLDAFKILCKSEEKIDWHLVIAGKFDSISYQNKIEQKIKESGLSEKIRFLGFIKEKEKFYDNIDICVIPSLKTVKETFGLVAIEAMYYSKPVVSISSGALTEILSFGPSGCICFQENPECLAETLKLLCENELKKRYIQNSKILLEYFFSYSRFKFEYLNLINNLLNNGFNDY